MEKEQILSTINEKLTAQGIKTDPWQRTYGDYLDRNLPAEGTEPDEAYFDKHVEILKSLAGQYNHQFATEVENFKKNYKPQTNSETKPTNDDGGKISALEKQIEELKNLVRGESAKNAADTLRKEAVARGNSLKVANKALWEDAVGSVEIGEKDSESDVIAKAKSAYEKLLKRYMGDGAAPYGSSGRQGATKEAEEAAKGKREALKKKMQARGRLPKPEQ